MKNKDESNFRPAAVIAAAIILILSLAAGAVATAAAEEDERAGAAPSRWERPLWNVGENLQESYFGRRAIPFHLAALAGTFLLVRSDADAKIQRWAAKQDGGTSLAWSAPGLFGGAAAPALLPGALLLSDNPETQEAGAAALQAAAIAFASASLLKALANRPGPEDGVAATNADARGFRWGFLRQGIVEGWPSGHAATNTAMSAALAAYYRDDPGIRAAAYGWAAYVSASAALGDQGGTHWMSDVVAGTLIGWAIGDTIGRKFADKNSGGDGGGFSIQPNMRNGGVEFTMRF